jgi:hypothetical protein
MTTVIKTIEEQIKNKCIHFNGIANHKCKTGVVYAKVSDKSGNPFKFPCLENTSFSGGYCDKRESPTKEYVNQQLKEIENLFNGTFKS